MTLKDVRQRIKMLQELAKTARYNMTLTEKRLATAIRKRKGDKVTDETLLLEVWGDTYECAKQDIYTYQGA